VIAAIRRGIDRWRGQGDHTVTLPPMDGALRPNSALDEARVEGQVPAVDNFVRAAGRLYASSERKLLAIDDGPSMSTSRVIAEFDAPISCLAGDAHGNVLAGFDDGRLAFVEGPRRGTVLDSAGPVMSCPTALLLGEESVLVCHGSQVNPPREWKRDLMQRGSSGSVWRIDLTGKAAPESLATGLAYPYGITRAADGRIVVAESWRHRLIALPVERGGPLQVLRGNLPAYPARIVPAQDGGFWLCMFAPRSRLVELVLTERDFCDDMLVELDPAHWVAPDLHSGSSYLEPLQGGGVKQMGILKPWAPSRSYGLLVRLDASFQPIASWHSRADGARHGVTSCIERGDRVLIACKGAGLIVSVNEATQSLRGDRR
jgi:hypothetical protein